MRLLDRLRAAGFTVRADAGRLLVAPKDRLTPADVAAVTAQREAVLAVLTGESPWADPATLTAEDRAVLKQLAAGAWDPGRFDRGALPVQLRRK